MMWLTPACVAQSKTKARRLVGVGAAPAPVPFSFFSLMLTHFAPQVEFLHFIMLSLLAAVS